MFQFINEKNNNNLKEERWKKIISNEIIESLTVIKAFSFGLIVS